jgi:serine/threonine-protein kinase
VEELAHKICPVCEQRALHEPRFCPNCAADLSEVETVVGDPYMGMVIEDRYALEECIGVGAMGRVYRATQTALNKNFAVKILHPHLTHDPESHERFAAEAQNAAGLSHPNVVSVVDYGRTLSGVTYLVMEHIVGRSLEQILIEEHPLPRARLVDLTLQILSGLTEAHGMGILHRDLKPENILVQSLRTRGELLKVLDFGIAKLMDSPDNTRPGLTSQGVVCGTPEFMSPEQARGKKLDGRSDLYAVGVILYQMITGRLPFAGDSAVELLHRHINEPPVHPAEVIGRDPEPLDELCMCALSKTPEGRFASASEFRNALVAVGRSTTNTQHCDNCRATLRASDKFCPECGTPVPKREAPPASGDPVQRTRGSLQMAAAATTSRLAQRFPISTVGRTQALETARRELNRNDADVRLLAISGVPGMGKSRVLEEVALEAAGLGWNIVRVSAEPSGASPPLWPIREAVRRVLGLGATITTQDLGRASNLIGLSFEALPGLAELFNLEGPLASAEFAVRRRECFVAAAQTLAGSSRDGRLLLALDDVERFDTSSRKVIQALRHQPAAAPILVLVASDERDLGWLEAPIIELTPFGANEIEEATKYVCTGEDGRTTEFLAELKGFEPITPLHLELALRELAAGRPLGESRSEGDILERRLASLPSGRRELLEAAAILGETCNEAELRQILTMTGGPRGEELDEVLAELHVEGWLPLGEPGRRRFSHGRVREFIYRNTSAERLGVLHAAAAEIAAHDGGPGRVIEAMHRLRAGDEDLVEVLSAAADEAVAAFDDRKSASLLKAALRVADLGGEALLEERTKLTSRLAYALCYAKQPDVALERLNQLEELSKQMSPASLAAWKRARGFALTRLQRNSEAAREYAQLAGTAITLGDAEILLQAHADHALALADAEQLERAKAEALQGLDMATMGEGPRADLDFPIWRYLLGIANLFERLGEERQSLQYCRHAVWRAERSGDSLALMRSHTDLARAFARAGQETRGEKHRTRAISLAREFGDRKTSAELLLERSEYKRQLPRPEEAKSCARSALKLAEVLEWGDGIRQARTLLERLRDTPTLK